MLDSLKTYNLIIKSDKIIDYIYIIKKKDLDTYNYATIKDSIFIKPTSSDTNIIILKPYSYDSYGNYNIKNNRKVMKKIISFLLIFFFINCFGMKKLSDKNMTNFELITIKGKIHKISKYKKTLSEYSYYIIKTNDQKDITLLNEKGYSLGFEKYVGKMLELKGYYSKGYIGLRNKKIEGFKIKKIKQINIKYN